MAIEIGSEPFKVLIPTQFDDASITEAFKYYHQGSLTDSIADKSIGRHLETLNDDIQETLAAIASLNNSVAALQAVVANLDNTYIRKTPNIADNNPANPLQGNIIKPSNDAFRPLILSNATSSGRGRLLEFVVTGRGTPAYVTWDGIMFANPILDPILANTNPQPVASRVLTEAGVQYVRNKILIAPTQTLGFVERTASFGLTTDMASKIIEVNGSGTTDIVVTIPEQAAPNEATWAEGMYFVIVRTGTQPVVIAGNGFTPAATPGLRLRDRWSMATIIKRRTGAWLVTGDTIPV